MKKPVPTKDLAPEEVDFIKTNYLQMSIIQMAETLNSNFYRVKSCMKQHNLVVDQKSIQEFRIKSMRKNTDYPRVDFWNRSLNPITMYTVNQ